MLNHRPSVSLGSQTLALAYSSANRARAGKVTDIISNCLTFGCHDEERATETAESTGERVSQQRGAMKQDWGQLQCDLNKWRIHQYMEHSVIAQISSKTLFLHELCMKCCRYCGSIRGKLVYKLQLQTCEWRSVQLWSQQMTNEQQVNVGSFSYLI